MTGKGRLLITLSIIGIIAAALLTSFGRNIFSNNIPSIVLPDLSTSADALRPDADWSEELSSLSPITVTIASVQDVIASLQRSDSYYRQMTVSLYWEDGSSSTPISVWCDGSWIATQQTTSAGLVRYDLVGDTAHYYWYDGDNNYLSRPVDSWSGDLAQRIPTYEDVLDLDSNTITDASYTAYLDVPAIFVEVSQDSRVERYWISAESGLLIGAETTVDDVLIYRLTGTDTIQTPCPSDAPFTLPNGTSISALG